MSDWQPIETVPQDGTRVLVGRFSGLRGDKHDGFMQVDWWRTDSKKDGFLGLGKFNTRHWPATHWQPLPEAPLSPRARHSAELECQ